MALTSFHLLSYGREHAPQALSRVGLDRPALRRVGGLRFWKLLGTGRGRTMTLSADLKRWAMLGVWEDEAALAAFLAESDVAGRWRERAREAAHLRLEPLRARGTWNGRVPIEVDGARPLEPGEPVAILTRAAIRPRALVSFYRAIAAPGADLIEQPGVLRALGVGEWPVARQATFSLWRSLPEVQAYAYRRADHAAVVRRTRDEDWYSEELFARFRVLSAEGTWDGTPVLSPGPPPPLRA
jgi:hypothetical protein